MLRNIYFEGELQNHFTKKMTVNAATYKEVFGCIEANYPQFRKFLLDCHTKDIGFILHVEEESIQESQLFEPIKEGDITLSIVPAGSKGVGKILAAIAVAYVTFMTFGTGASFLGFSAQGGAWGAGLGLSTAQQGLGYLIGMAGATRLAMSGLQDMYAMDGSLDSPESNNFLFSGGADSIDEGDPVGLLYGQLTVPGRPVSVNVVNGIYTNNDAFIDHVGDIYTFDDTKYDETKATIGA